MALAAVGCGTTTSSPHLRVTPVHTFSLCSSSDCGGFSATLNWTAFSWAHTTTGYNLLLNGSAYATATTSPFTFAGMDCGTTFTLGVQAVDGTGDTSAIYTISYTTPSCPTMATFPLQVSGNGRFLETAGGSPWLLVGDSPQSVMGNLSVSNAAAYFADRETQGFDAVWANLLCETYTACNSDGKAYNNATSTADNLAPFTSGTSQTTYSMGTGTCGDCNTAYFSQMHTEVAQANTDGLAVFLDPIPTDACGGLTYIATLENNGDGTVSTTDADYKYGQFLGTTFGDLPNVVWQLGNDFTCYTTTADDADLMSVANGIENTDPGSLVTNEICSSGMCGGGGSADEGFTSLDDTTHDWTGRITLNESYTYAPTYAEDQRAYAQTPTMPMFMGEANYEGQKNGASADGCGAGAASDPTARLCRLQDWWTMTSGATGQLYGGPCYGITNSTSLSSCDSAGASQLDAQATFLRTIAWQTLAPDANGTGHLVTSGGGSCPTTGNFAAVTCVTAATNEAGSDNLALIYMPNPSSLGTVTVDETKLSGTVTSTWVDPADGAEMPATHGGTTSAATFTPTGNNSVGDKDWVLLLQS